MCERFATKNCALSIRPLEHCLLNFVLFLSCKINIDAIIVTTHSKILLTMCHSYLWYYFTCLIFRIVYEFGRILLLLACIHKIHTNFAENAAPGYVLLNLRIELNIIHTMAKTKHGTQQLYALGMK